MPLQLVRALWNAHRQAPGQALLMLLGLATSVAVVVAIDLAVDSARSAFLDSRRALSGAATHQIVADGGEVSMAQFADLRARGLWRSAPLIEREALALPGGQRLRLLGVDPLSESTLRPWLGGGVRSPANGPNSSSPGALIGRSDAALLPEALARTLGVAPGDRLRLRVDGRAVDYELLGLLPDAALPAGSADWVLLDIAGAQRATGGAGFSRIDLVLDETRARDLAARLPLGLRLLATSEQDGELAQMSAAFEVNLKALSLLALLVGVFVVFQTLSFLAVQRRRLIGLLRAIGVRRGELSRLLLGEALLVGLVAGGIGITLGIALGSSLLPGLARSYGELFYRVDAGGLAIAAPTLLKALALALGGALLAVLLPLRDALAVTPLDALARPSAGQAQPDARMRALFWPALLLFTGGLALVTLAPPGLLWGFAGLFACLIAGLGLIPWAARHLLEGLERALRPAPVLGQWLVAGSRRSLGRTGIALAALSLAIATVIGMGSMIHSFRVALGGWIERSLQAEVYLSASGRSALPEGLVDRVAALPGVEALSLTRRSQRLAASGPLEVVGIALPPRGRAGFELLAGEGPELWSRFEAGAALASEPLTTRLGLRVGDRLELPTAQGPRNLEIVGIYRDYSSPQGVLTLSLQHYQRAFGDPAIGALGVYARPEDAPALAAALRALVADDPALQVVTAAQIRTLSLEVFARTFAITDVLHLLSGLIALVAVLGALSALAIERSREFALLRAIGLLPRQLLRLQLLQGGTLGLLAGLCALPLGLGLAVLLIEVINRRSFGWSMQLDLPWAQILGALAIAILAAVLAAWWPARRSARGDLVRALRGSGP